MPWDKKYKPIPFLIANSCDLQRSPPIDSSSTAAIGPFSRSPRTTIISNSHISPNVSFTEQHDDSGLESV